MGIFERSRHITTDMFIARPDGTLINVSEFLTDATINLGDVSQAGDSGADGVCRSLDFTLKNDNDNNFSPKRKYGVLKYHTQTIEGDGGNIYTLDYSGVIENSIRIRDRYYEMWEDMPTWSASGTWEDEKTNENDIKITVKKDKKWQDTGMWNNEEDWGTPETRLELSYYLQVGESIRIGYTYLDSTEQNPYNWHLGAYSPLIWENRKVYLRTIAEKPKYKTKTINCTGVQRYATDGENIIQGTARLKTSSNSFWTETINVDYDTNEFIFDSANIPTNGTVLVLQYSYFENEPKTIFEGYITEFQVSKTGVQVFCKDEGKLLQNAFCTKGTIRNYTNTKSGDIWSVTDGSTTWTNGIPLEEFLQNCIDDFYGVDDFIVLNCAVSPSYNVLPVAEQYEYKTLWDILQSFASQIGWYIGYTYDSTSDSFKLNLLEPNRDKTEPDYIIDADNDIYIQELNISGENIRNSIKVNFLDADNNYIKTSVTVSDSASISEYNERPAEIEEENTSAIDTIEEAENLATAILNDSKDLLAGVRLELPLFLELKLFDMLGVKNYNLSSDIENVSVQNISHRLSSSNKQFRTEVSGYQKIIGAKTKWEKIQTRPSRFRQITAKTSDTVLAKVRDNTLHIKTQADFENWMNSFEFSATAPTTDTWSYDKVIIYNTGADYIYTITHTSTYKRYYSKIKKLQLLGIGQPKLIFISRCYDTNYNTVFQFTSNDFLCEGIDFQTRVLNNSGSDYLTDGKVILIAIDEYDSTAPADGIANFNKCKFEFYKQTGTYDAFCVGIVARTNNLTQNIKIENCTFRNLNGFLASTVATGKTKLVIDGNIFENADITTQPIYLIWGYISFEDLIITRNTVKNMIIYLQSITEALTMKNIRISQNSFYLDQSRTAYIFLSGLSYNLVIQNLSVSDNNIIYKTATLDFIYFQGRSGGITAGCKLEYSTISNNVASQDTSGTLSNFLNVTANVAKTAVGETNNQK